MAAFLLHYFLTNRCNARCAFCGIWQEQPKQDASTDDVLANLVSARRAGCKFVDFTGGEPLMHPDLPLFLARARELGFLTSVTTNCLLFEKRVHELAGLVDLLHFSLDGDTPEVHDAIRGCRSYDAVMRSIAVAREHDLVPDLLFTYTDQNIDAFDGVRTMAGKNRLMVILDPVFSIDGRDPVSDQTHRKALGYATKSGVYLNPAHIELRRRGGNETSHPLCRAVSSTVVLLPNNSLALPCFHHACTRVPIGHDLHEVLTGRARSEAVKRQGTYSFCRGCHINCYFDPSYMSLFNGLWLRSMGAKISYALTKYVAYRTPFPLHQFLGHPRSAAAWNSDTRVTRSQ